jgi:hypothetical protein
VRMRNNHSAYERLVTARSCSFNHVHAVNAKR